MILAYLSVIVPTLFLIVFTVDRLTAPITASYELYRDNEWRRFDDSMFYNVIDLLHYTLTHHVRKVTYKFD